MHEEGYDGYHKTYLRKYLKKENVMHELTNEIQLKSLPEENIELKNLDKTIREWLEEATKKIVFKYGTGGDDSFFERSIRQTLGTDTEKYTTEQKIALKYPGLSEMTIKDIIEIIRET